jgi:redox-sensitive bicupin YhaK (pirin superfamily)
VIDGRVDLNGDRLRTVDSAKITGAADVSLETDIAAEVILIDVPLEFEPVGVWAGE